MCPYPTASPRRLLYPTSILQPSSHKDSFFPFTVSCQWARRHALRLLVYISILKVGLRCSNGTNDLEGLGMANCLSSVEVFTFTEPWLTHDRNLHCQLLCLCIPSSNKQNTESLPLWKQLRNFFTFLLSGKKKSYICSEAGEQKLCMNSNIYLHSVLSKV